MIEDSVNRGRCSLSSRGQLCPRKGTLHVEGFAWPEQKAAAGYAGCTSTRGPCRVWGELSSLGISRSHQSCQASYCSRDTRKRTVGLCQKRPSWGRGVEGVTCGGPVVAMAMPWAGRSPAAVWRPGSASGRGTLGVPAPQVTLLYYTMVVVLGGTTSSRVLLSVQSRALPGGTDLLRATWRNDSSSTLPYRKGCHDSDTPLSWPVHRNQSRQQQNQQPNEKLLKSFSQRNQFCADEEHLGCDVCQETSPADH